MLVPSRQFPSGGRSPGRYVTLAPADPAGESDELWQASHGTPEREAIWRFLPDGPFADAAGLRASVEETCADPRTLYLTVRAADGGAALGMAGFLNITPAHRTLELGAIWYVPQAQRTRVNTETIYLMLVEAFDRLQYRRVEWKCDTRNERSQAAAQRLGFRFEGIFRQHRIVRGENRDTAWFSMLDGEWPAVKANLEGWLYGGDGAHPLRRQDE